MFDLSAAADTLKHSIITLEYELHSFLHYILFESEHLEILGVCVSLLFILSYTFKNYNYFQRIADSSL